MAPATTQQPHAHVNKQQAAELLCHLLAQSATTNSTNTRQMSSKAQTMSLQWNRPMMY
jgi:hypothetical protein